MIFSVPSDWVEISKEQFDKLVDEYGESREGFAGVIVWYGTNLTSFKRKSLLAAAMDDGKYFCDVFAQDVVI